MLINNFLLILNSLHQQWGHLAVVDHPGFGLRVVATLARRFRIVLIQVLGDKAGLEGSGIILEGIIHYLNMQSISWRN